MSVSRTGQAFVGEHDHFLVLMLLGTCGRQEGDRLRDRLDELLDGRCTYQLEVPRRDDIIKVLIPRDEELLKRITAMPDVLSIAHPLRGQAGARRNLAYRYVGDDQHADLGALHKSIRAFADASPRVGAVRAGKLKGTFAAQHPLTTLRSCLSCGESGIGQRVIHRDGRAAYSTIRKSEKALAPGPRDTTRTSAPDDSIRIRFDMANWPVSAEPRIRERRTLLEEADEKERTDCLREHLACFMSGPSFTWGKGDLLYRPLPTPPGSTAKDALSVLIPRERQSEDYVSALRYLSTVHAVYLPVRKGGVLCETWYIPPHDRAVLVDPETGYSLPSARDGPPFEFEV
ncbi:hypothetical protein LTR85_000298 [Meristemomyces frigidus]|nr:hypothetical protein LTR85_000298 [Meristemomyces frigidus]